MRSCQVRNNKIGKYLRRMWHLISHHNAPVIALELAIFVGIIFALAAPDDEFQPISTNFASEASISQPISTNFASTSEQISVPIEENNNETPEDPSMGSGLSPSMNSEPTGQAVEQYSNPEELKIKEIQPEKYAFKSLEGDIIEIGTEINSPPKPYFKINKWSGESNFSLAFSNEGDFNIKLDNGKVVSDDSNYNFEFEPVGKKEEFNDSGGLDMSITLKKEPSANQLLFNYDNQSVTAYPQPSLKQGYKDGWSDEFKTDIKVTDTDVTETDTGKVLIHRPDYAVNSIAFYGSENQVNNNYKTGKIGHLYRMKAIDANNNWVWADWILSGNTIALTADQTFLDTAIYPVVIAPVGDTFGYTTAGATTVNMETNTWYGSLFTATTTGTGTSISIYAQNYQSAPNVPKLKGVLVNHSDLTIVTNGITAATSTLLSPATYKWYTANFGTGPSIAAADYVIGVIPYYYHSFKYDTGSASQSHSELDNNFDTPTNPSGVAEGNYKLSIYVTFTADTAESYQPRPPATSPSGGGFLIF